MTGHLLWQDCLLKVKTTVELPVQAETEVVLKSDRIAELDVSVLAMLRLLFQSGSTAR